MTKALGLKVRYKLNKVGIGSDGLYDTLLKKNQGRITKITSLAPDMPGPLAIQKGEVDRIWGEVEGKYNAKNVKGAADQFAKDLVPALDTAEPGAVTHIAAKGRYTTEFVQKQGEIDATDIITHRLPLSEGAHAYDIFDHKKDNCIKVILKP